MKKEYRLELAKILRDAGAYPGKGGVMARADDLLNKLRGLIEEERGEVKRPYKASLIKFAQAFEELDDLCTDGHLPDNWKPYEEDDTPFDKDRRDRARARVERERFARETREENHKLMLQLALIKGVGIIGMSVPEMHDVLATTARAVKNFKEDP